MTLQIILLFVPFLFLFVLGFEIYLKNPRNRMNRLCMLLMISFSMFFLGGFFANMVDLEDAVYVLVYVKYISVFITMMLSIYMLYSISKVSIQRKLKHMLCLMPLLGILPVVSSAPESLVTISPGPYWRHEQLAPELLAAIFVITGYTFMLMLLFIGSGTRQGARRKWQPKELQRMEWIKKGLLFSLLWALFWAVVSAISDAFSPGSLLGELPYDTLPAYCIMIWGFFIRYAVVRFDFLASPGRRYELLFALSKQGIALINDKGIAVEMNSAFRTMFGIMLLEPQERINVMRFLPQEHKARLKEVFDKSFASQTPMHAEMEMINYAGEQMFVEFDSDYLEINGQLFCYLVTREITDKKHTELRLQKLAYQDNLTGLGNRLFFMEKLEAVLSEMEDRGGPVAVLLLDLDQFKWINDTLGHAAGDMLLQHVGKQLEEALPQTSVVARLGGDEFAVTMPVADTGEAFSFAKVLLSALQQPNNVLGKSYTLSASIGISIAPDDGSTGGLLLSNSDTAMYAAKQAGRNQYSKYTPELKAMAERNLSLVNGLGSALTNNEFSLHYQPQVDIRTNKIMGVEALLRWSSPELGAVSPAQFIPIAEETGMITAIGDWVLNDAFRQARLWIDQGHTGIKVSVNLSAHQLKEPLFAANIDKLLKHYKLPAHNICLEITESTAIFDPQKSLEICEELVELGVVLAIDDFGTGYSSLNMLNRFPFGYIKIDRSLVQNITTQPKDAAVIQTMIELSGRLDMQVIAEGVETPEQLSLLKALGCHKVQGYLCGRPMPAGQITDTLSEDLIQA